MPNNNPPTRGRPRKEPTTVVNVRIPNHVYDRYIIRAQRARVPVRSILREIVTRHAPRDDEGEPEAGVLFSKLIINDNNAHDRRSIEAARVAFNDLAKRYYARALKEDPRYARQVGQGIAAQLKRLKTAEIQHEIDEIRQHQSGLTETAATRIYLQRHGLHNDVKDFLRNLRMQRKAFNAQVT